MTLTDELVRAAVDYLHAQGERRVITYDSKCDRLVVGAPPDAVSYIFLGHARAEGRQLGSSDYTRLLARRLWASVRGSAEPGDAARAVLPRLRDRSWFSVVRRQAELELGADARALDEVMLPHRQVNEELAVHLAFELPTSVTEVGADRLQVWGRTFDELLPIALDNLRRRSKLPMHRPMPGVYTSPYHDALDASRLLLPELFTALQLKGAPVAIAPTHDLLFVTGDGDAAGLHKIATWAEEALSEPRALTALAFRLEGNQWMPWMPPRKHRAWPKMQMLRLQTTAAAYARQKEVLEHLLDATGRDIVVVPLRAFRTEKGDVFTASAWVENLEALLPETDRLDFIRPAPDDAPQAAQVWSTTFEVARRTLGELMEPTGDTPQRYRVRGFPSAAQLEQMAREGHLPE